MFSTIVLVVAFLGLLVVQVVLWAVFLRLGLRWAKVPDVTTRRIVVATAVVVCIQAVLGVLFRLPNPSSDALVVLFAALGLLVSVSVPCLVISRVFKASFFRSMQAWIPTLLAPVATIAFGLLVLRPFVCEGFFNPTNPMAPTLLGNHCRGTCPECGEPNICSRARDQYARLEPSFMICENFHVSQISDVDPQVFSGDRFLVAKFLTPRRWDIVIFQFPGEPSVHYVMRLVGLPGETIHIEDGAVWADGDRLEPPDSLDGIEYVSEFPDYPTRMWGTEERPAVLGDDEYFVLGDFSTRSNDSRLWAPGAPGYNPYAVPESHMRGVVTHIYWPPQRWRILR